MATIVVEGGYRLKGTVTVSGSKNAVLPILAASLLARSKSTIKNIPNLEDVKVICRCLKALGAEVVFENDNEVTIDSSHPISFEAPYDLVRKMRASFLVAGPLLATVGRVKISMPGGCAIGSRPIDLHLKGFKALGAEIMLGHGFIEMSCNSLKGNRIYLDYPSVGATENIMMASVLAEGETIIENAAEEPEIIDLANYLCSIGAKIKGAGTDLIKISGVKELKGSYYSVIPDRIEAGTFMVAAAITRGSIVVKNCVPEHLKSIIAKLNEAGVEILEGDNEIYLRAPEKIKAVDVRTLPYPGFPTDLQAQFIALMSTAEGISIITETVFENRFMHVDELKRMGAEIKIEGRSAIVKGCNELSGAPVRATDLRAGAALVIAGLAARGKTFVMDAYHIDRGYEKFEEKLRRIGAKVFRT